MRPWQVLMGLFSHMCYDWIVSWMSLDVVVYLLLSGNMEVDQLQTDPC